MAVFKSYDIRGTYPDQLNAEIGYKIGLAMGKHYSQLPENEGKSSLTIVVGRDMRTSAPEMSQSLIDGLTDAGHQVKDIGMVTTPCVYYAVQHLGADGGVCCTASHNPPKYSGFKVTRELAIPISYDTGLNQVEAMLEEPKPNVEKGSVEQVDLDNSYIDFLVGLAGDNLKPLRIAADASNGMAGKFLEQLFDRFPCHLEGLYLTPDGTFPNHEADPLKEENLQDVRKLVQATGAAIGFCFDGDGDRVAIVDNEGKIVGCDLITALIAQDLLKDNPGRKVTYDLRSSKVVKEVIENAGGEAVRSRVGHSHVKQAMRKMDALFGGELSGHYYFRLQDKDVFYADSALVAVVSLLRILSNTDKTCAELIDPMRKYFHTGEINYSVIDKDAALGSVAEMFSDGQQDELDGVSVEYENWWVNVRPSNTEPLLRLTLEGDTADLRDQGLAKVEEVLGQFGERATSSH